MKLHHPLAIASCLGLLLSAGSQAAVFSHYSFDSDLTDDSGNARHGTLTDVGTLGNSDITTTGGEFVFGGGAMNFSADRDYIQIARTVFGTGTA